MMMNGMLLKFLLLALLVLPVATASAGPPLDRMPMTGIEILEDDPSKLHVDRQVIIGTNYRTIYPNMNYTIIMQILDEKDQVVYLSWIESHQNETSQVDIGSYICGDKICPNPRAHLEDYVCGDKVCRGGPLDKSAQFSWLPTRPGEYYIAIFGWEALDNPTALSPPQGLDVTVT